MGSSKNAAEFVGKLTKLPQAVQKAQKQAVRANASLARKNAEAEVRRVAGADARLSGAGGLVRAGTRVVGRKGAKLSVGTKPQQGGDAELVYAIGAWPLVENDMPRHEIGPSGQDKETLFGPALTKSGRAKKLKSASGKATAKGRTGRAKALRTPYGLKRRVMHPGTKGKKPWAKAAKKTAADAPKALKQAMETELKKVIR